MYTRYICAGLRCDGEKSDRADNEEMGGPVRRRTHAHTATPAPAGARGRGSWQLSGRGHVAAMSPVTCHLTRPRVAAGCCPGGGPQPQHHHCPPVRQPEPHRTQLEFLGAGLALGLRQGC